MTTHEPGDLMMAPTAGQTDDKGPRPSRPGRVIMGRLKTEGMRNISFTRKQDPYLYPTCNREEVSSNSTRTLHVKPPLQLI